MAETIKFICPECRNIWLVEEKGIPYRDYAVIYIQDIDCDKCGTKGMTMQAYERWIKKYDTTITE